MSCLPSHRPIQLLAGRRPQRGAAILAAMLTVSFVATFAIFTQWQLWRAIEVERAERAQVQSQWMMSGGADFSKMPLREDMRGQGAMVDHLDEIFLKTVIDAPLKSFLTADKNNQSTLLGDEVMEAYLKGHIEDAQSRLNLGNLVVSGAVVDSEFAIWQRLFAQLGLPQQELLQLRREYLLAVTDAAMRQTAAANPALMAELLRNDANALPKPFTPTKVDQLTALGLSPPTVKALERYIIILPAGSKINLNTASDVVLAAAVPGLSVGGARMLQKQPIDNLAMAASRLGLPATALDPARFDVRSNYFLLNSQLRFNELKLIERSLIHRQSRDDIRVIWRERVNADELAAPTAAR